MIREITKEDAPEVCRIYNPYVQETTITFEETPFSSETMQGRIAEVTTSLPWLVWEENGAVRGYAYATSWRARSAYRFSVETTVYLEQGMQGRGWAPPCTGNCSAFAREGHSLRHGRNRAAESGQRVLAREAGV